MRGSVTLVEGEYGPPQPPPAIYELLDCGQNERPLDPTLLRAVTAHYEGGLSQDRRFHGDGAAYFLQGFAYRGEFLEGRMGTPQHPVSGRMSWYDGVEYQGTFVDNVASGTGTLAYPNGDTYVGEVQGGLRHGRGEHRCKQSGSSYTGSWWRGQKHGRGVMKYAHGGLYDGEWMHGHKHGKGKMIYASGSEYDGDWVRDVREGEGTMTWRHEGVATAKFQGSWKAGRAEGEGSQVYLAQTATSRRSPQLAEALQRRTSSTTRSDGRPAETAAWPPPQRVNRYSGSFKAGVRHGNGTFHYVDGSMYEGLWEENKKQGSGKLVFSNGACYVGTFNDGQPAKAGLQAQKEGPVSTHVPLFIDDLLVHLDRPAEALHRLQCAVSRHYWGLRYLYDYYASLPIGTTPCRPAQLADGPFLTVAQFWKLLTETGVCGGPGTPSLAIVDRLLRRFKDQTETTAALPQPPKQKQPDLPPPAPVPQPPGAASEQGTPTGAPAMGTGEAEPADAGSQPLHSPPAPHVPAPPPHRKDDAAAADNPPLPPSGAANAETPQPSAGGSRPRLAGGLRTGAARPSNVGSAQSPPPSVGASSHQGGQQPPSRRVSAARSVGERSARTARSGRTTPTATRGDRRVSGARLTSERVQQSQQVVVPEPPPPPQAQVSMRWNAFRTAMHANAHQIDFREFIEALVRVAAHKYASSGAGWSLTEMFEHLISDDLRPNAGSALPFLKDARGLASVVERHGSLLQRLFKLYSARSFGGLELHQKRLRGDDVITVRQLLTLLRESGVVGSGRVAMRSVLGLFEEPEPWQRVPRADGVTELLPTPHCPLTPVPPTEKRDGPRHRSNSQLTQRSMVPQPSRQQLLGTSYHRGNRAPSKLGVSKSEMMLSGLTTVSAMPRAQTHAASSANCGESVGSQMSRRSSPQQRRGDDASETGVYGGEISCVDSERTVTPDGVGARAAQIAEQERLKQERLRERRVWLEQVSKGRRDRNVTSTIIVDQELVFSEFVDALAKVARLRITDESDASARFDRFLEQCLSAAAAGRAEAAPAY
eukprot:TRINITY_DN916_c4_g1_i1.p1 TRINITY_DN916_c4_g1~~TRINITY_DN916_c4_g1_i1.p1  ORF type:complete len:1045 (+),score=342.87 TRINITY_DN916_c4_g1_i1:62-3196(+)